MNILILFECSKHNQTIDYLCDNLINNNLEVASFNMAFWRYRNYSSVRISVWMKLLTYLARIPKLRGFLSKFVRSSYVLKLSDGFDNIDIHFFSEFYDQLIIKFKEKNKKVKITIWGSDFYRVISSRREEQRKIYQIVDIIQIETRQIADDFLEIYPECKDKIRIAHFGINQFDIIDKLLEDGTPLLYRKELKIPDDRLVITCGTNGSKAHQHLKMLESIENLSPSIKERLFLIIPMTYGGVRKYIDIVTQKANELGIPFRVFKSFLSEKETAKLRITSDILLTIQTTDALSITFQEYIYAGNTFIAGEWLPYDIVKEYGVSYITTTINNLTGDITRTVQTFDSERSLFSDNKAKLSKLSSWKEAIKKWTVIYDEMIIR